MNHTTDHSGSVPTLTTNSPVPTDKSIIKQSSDILAAENPLELIKKADIDLVGLLKNLNRIATSATLFAKDNDGFPMELGEDNKAQITATIAIFELAKLIKDKTTAVQVGIFNDPKIVEEATRVLELKKRI